MFHRESGSKPNKTVRFLRKRQTLKTNIGRIFSCVTEKKVAQELRRSFQYKIKNRGNKWIKEDPMPGIKYLRGVGAKEQRQYEHIKESAQKSGRYGKRAEEVAARTVLKHHKEHRHAKGK